jgi:hypothetical protein
MTIAQNLFTVFYGVLFAAMLSGLTGLFAFPWGFPQENDGKARLLWRLVVSILCFNVLPFLIFALGFEALGGRVGALAPWQVFCVAFASLSVFAPYRLYTLLLVLLDRVPCLALYSPSDLEKVIKKRSIRKSVTGNLLAVAFYGATLGDLWLV